MPFRHVDKTLREIAIEGAAHRKKLRLAVALEKAQEKVEAHLLKTDTIEERIARLGVTGYVDPSELQHMPPGTALGEDLPLHIRRNRKRRVRVGHVGENSECNKCGKTKDLSEFPCQSLADMKFSTVCRTCTTAAAKRRKAERLQEGIMRSRDDRMCSKCHQMRPYQHFGQTTTTVSGFYHSCRKCRSEARYARKGIPQPQQPHFDFEEAARGRPKRGVYVRIYPKDPAFLRVNVRLSDSDIVAELLPVDDQLVQNIVAVACANGFGASQIFIHDLEQLSAAVTEHLNPFNLIYQRSLSQDAPPPPTTEFPEFPQQPEEAYEGEAA